MPTPVGHAHDRLPTAPQQRVLDGLVEHIDPVTAADLAAELALHHNTVREHLDSLVEQGRARRRAGRRGGRGRPPWTYEAAPSGLGAGAAPYLGLAEAFAEHLALTSPRPSTQAREVGRRWGTRLAGADPDPPQQNTRPAGGRQAGAHQTDPPQTFVGAADSSPDPVILGSRRRLVDLLGEVGFAPEPSEDHEDVALRECPLLDAARTHPEVVCELHHGLVVGALASYGNSVDVVRLTPFAQPGACRLRLGPAAR